MYLALVSPLLLSKFPEHEHVLGWSDDFLGPVAARDLAAARRDVQRNRRRKFRDFCRQNDFALDVAVVDGADDATAAENGSGVGLKMKIVLGLICLARIKAQAVPYPCLTRSNHLDKRTSLQSLTINPVQTTLTREHLAQCGHLINSLQSNLSDSLWNQLTI